MQSGVAVFHPGVQHSWQTAFALQQLGELSFYASSIFHQPERWPYRIERHLPAAWARRPTAEVRRFAGPPLDPPLVETFGAAEWLGRLARRAGRSKLAGRIDSWGNRRFARGLSHLIDARDPAVLWEYNGASLETFAGSHHAGRVHVLDSTTGDFRVYNAAMDAMHDRYAAFFPSPDHRIPQAQIDRDDAEYEAADIILTGSDFAARTVAEQARDPRVKDRVRVLEYCLDEALFASFPPPRPKPLDRPVRRLFVGQAGARRGIHLLLHAIARIPPAAATLSIVGDLQVPDAAFAPFADRVSYRPTVARQYFPAIMAGADVLVCPGYFEGTALSLIEALSAGLALIQSANAGLGVTPETGILLSSLSEQAFYDAMMTMVDYRARLNAFRAAAQGEAQRYHLARYRERIASPFSSVG